MSKKSFIADLPLETKPAAPDLSAKLPAQYDLTNDIKMAGKVETVVRDQRYLVWGEPERDYEITIWMNSAVNWPVDDDDDCLPNQDQLESGSTSDDYEDGLTISHGCHCWQGQDAFEMAFNHYDPNNYESEGDVDQINEAYRRLQEKALEYGWVEKRAPNSIILRVVEPETGPEADDDNTFGTKGDDTF